MHLILVYVWLHNPGNSRKNMVANDDELIVMFFFVLDVVFWNV